MKIYELVFIYPNKWDDGYFPCESVNIGVFDAEEKAKQVQEKLEPLLPLLAEYNYDIGERGRFGIYETELNKNVGYSPDDFVSDVTSYGSVDELRKGLEPIEVDPSEEEARRCNAEGILLHHQGKFDEAIAMFEQALNLAPDNEHIKSNRDVALAVKNMKGEPHVRNA